MTRLLPASQLVSLGSLASVDSGPAFQSKYFQCPEVGTRLLRGDNIEPGRLRWERTKTWPDNLLPGYEHLLVAEDDIILAMDRPIISSGLKLAKVVTADLPALLVQRVARIRASDAVLPAFLYYAMQTPEFLHHLRGNQVGTQLPHITLRGIKEFRVPLLPLDQQRHIVEILEDHLSRLDAGARLRLAAQRQLVAFRQAQLQSLVSFDESTPTSIADLVLRVEAGKSFGAATRPARDDEWGIVRVSAMTWGEFRPEENKVVLDESRVDPRFEIRDGDVLVSRANTAEYVGAPVLVRNPRPRLLLSDKSLRLVPRDGVRPEWLHRVLAAPRTRRQISLLATGTKDSMRNISQDALLTVKVPFVGESVQSEIVRAAASLDEAVAHLQATLADTARREQALRRAALAAAFSGPLHQGNSTVEEIEELVGV